MVTDDPATRTVRVHLLAYNSPAQTMPAKDRPYVLPALIEEAPTYRVEVESAQAVRRATAWNKSTSLQRHGRRVEATVSDIHEVLCLQY